MALPVKKVSGLRHTVIFLFVFLLNTGGNHSAQVRRILVFDKTEGYRHKDAIAAGQKAFFQLGREHHVVVDTTGDASFFNDDNLRQYNAVVLLNISGAVFNAEQRIGLRRYVQAGGGVLAIHAAADAERDWPWYGRLIGAYFDSHPPVQKGLFAKTAENHPASAFLPDTFSRTDEFYNFQQVSPDIKVLVTLDESSYTGGNMGSLHPAVWYQELEGGRSFYTSWGHSKENWDEPFYLRQIWEGLNWVMRDGSSAPLDYSRSIPEDNRFVRQELISKMDEPMQMAILPGGNVFVAQRRGSVLFYDAGKKSVKTAGTIPVLSAYEDGLLGIAADPSFKKSRWIYVFYAHPGLKDSIGDYHVSRFSITRNNTLDLTSEKVLLKIPHLNADGIHTGGGMLFDPRGSGDLFIAVGDNSSPRATLYSPLDEIPGRELFNAQRSSANTNDLRGKILRIHPEQDGTYSIPKGNLFPEGMEKTRPEIYSMGHRQPWRLSMDTQTGWLYAGEVGPDASMDSAGRGPMAYDEFNQIREPGNFGWPYFGGSNRPYYAYDFATGISGKPFDPLHPLNQSRLNTGLKELPPAKGAMVWYSAVTSADFPLMGRGGRSAMGGPVFREADFEKVNRFPPYYEGKWFITDWLRDWIMVVTMDSNGNYKSMERFLPEMPVAGIMDMQFGPDGCLYILGYGKGWFRQNDDSRLLKITYNPGNRAPVPAPVADRTHGRAPLEVKLSSKGTKDFDGDSLSYSWQIRTGKKVLQTFRTPDAAVQFDREGIYKAVLTVTDVKGASASDTVDIYVGNSAPEVNIEITKGNQTFFFPEEEMEYQLSVRDHEDGTWPGTIVPENIFVSMSYSADGFKMQGPGELTAPQRGIGVTGGMIVNASDCYHCHSMNKKSIGPAFTEIAERYKGDKTAEDRLAGRVIGGGTGSWGTMAMPPHPELSVDDAKKMVKFILSLSHTAPASLPLKGKHTLQLPRRLTAKGVYLLYARYTDLGANGLPPATGKSVIVLRPPWLLPSEADFRRSGTNVKIPNNKGEVEILEGNGAYIAYRDIDLTDIRSLAWAGEGNGILEIRIDAPDGRLIGRSDQPATRESGNNPKEEETVSFKIAETKGKHDLYLVVNGKGYRIRNAVIPEI